MNIFGFKYKVFRDKDLNEMNAFGRHHGDKLQIQIASDMNEQQEQSTMIHEILEAVNFHLSLGMEHTAIVGCEIGLYQTLLANGVDLSPLLKDAIVKKESA